MAEDLAFLTFQRFAVVRVERLAVEGFGDQAGIGDRAVSSFRPGHPQN